MIELILYKLIKMLDEINVLGKKFQTIEDRYKETKIPQ